MKHCLTHLNANEFLKGNVVNPVHIQLLLVVLVLVVVVEGVDKCAVPFHLVVPLAMVPPPQRIPVPVAIQACVH